jgi:hypothetical protein
MQQEVTPRNLAALIPAPLIIERDDGMFGHRLARRRARTVRIPVVRAGCRRGSGGLQGQESGIGVSDE